MGKNQPTEWEPLLKEKQRFEKQQGKLVENYSRFVDSYTRFREMAGKKAGDHQETARWRSNLVAKLER